MSRLRISSGTAKNIILETPKVPGYRAVQEVAKQSIFNIIGEDIKGKECLDLYAGSGNMGLEALSKGAKLCDFVDEDKKATEVIQRNAIRCGFEENVEVMRTDVVKYVANTPEKYDYIFVDPFYNNTSHIFLMKNMQDILNANGTVVFLHGGGMDWEKTLKDTKFGITEERRFGKSHVTFLKLA